MSQNSARAGLAVAFLVAAGAVAFYVLKSGDTKVAAASQGKQPSGEAYKPFATPGASDHAPSWDKTVRIEDDLWTYDLFTPVEVSWDPTAGEYKPKGGPVYQKPPFGLSLVSIKHPHYRYRLAALVEGDKGSENTVVLIDLNTGAPLRGTKGSVIEKDGGKIKILDYANKTVKNPTSGAIVRDTVVTIKDLVLKKDFEVRQTPTVFTDKTDIVFGLEDSTTPVWTAHAVGDKFENEAGSYVIKGIDFDVQSVTVEKTWTEEKPKHAVKTELKDLRPEAPRPTTPTSPAATKPATTK